MATLQQVEQHRRAIADVTAIALSDLVTVWRSMTLDDAAQAKREVLAVLPLLIDQYGTAAASLSADWYDELRDEARASGRFRAVPAILPEAAQLEALAGFAVGPLYRAEPDTTGALSLLSGGTQRLLAGMSRSTIAESTATDPSGPSYARHASSDACAFCALIATRGAVFTDEESALRVVGRGTPLDVGGGRRIGRRAEGVKTRGTRALGEKYHDACRCTPVPVWPGQALEQPSYVSDWRKAYEESVASHGEPGRTGLTYDEGLRKTLADMRERLDVH